MIGRLFSFDRPWLDGRDLAFLALQFAIDSPMVAHLIQAGRSQIYGCPFWDACEFALLVLDSIDDEVGYFGHGIEVLVGNLSSVSVKEWLDGLRQWIDFEKRNVFQTAKRWRNMIDVERSDEQRKDGRAWPLAGLSRLQKLRKFKLRIGLGPIPGRQDIEKHRSFGDLFSQPIGNGARPPEVADVTPNRRVVSLFGKLEAKTLVEEVDPASRNAILRRAVLLGGIAEKSRRQNRIVLAETLAG